MNIREMILKPQPVWREIPGVGRVKVRQLTVREVLETSKCEDRQEGTRKMIAAAILDEKDKPVFDSADQVNEVSWSVLKGLAAAVTEVNQLNAGDAEKNSPAPPSSD